jgi:hypothetical protein
MGFLHRTLAIALGFLGGVIGFYLGTKLMVARPEEASLATILGGLAAFIPSLLIFSWVALKPNPSLVQFLASGIFSVAAAIAILGCGFYAPIIFFLMMRGGLLLPAIAAGLLGTLLCWGYLVCFRQIPLRWH